ncbi:MHYT domain-containing protein [Streptomyces sp. NPDC001380]|uniref:MHYT domain-containing protein n=1 Tax=Streptomyces sp. NPDC001380 TaxID=3364566 RepID=UPI0036B7CAB1
MTPHQTLTVGALAPSAAVAVAGALLTAAALRWLLSGVGPTPVWRVLAPLSFGTTAWSAHCMALVGAAVGGAPLHRDASAEAVGWAAAVLLAAGAVRVLERWRRPAASRFLAGAALAGAVLAVERAGMSAAHLPGPLDTDVPGALLCLAAATAACTLALEVLSRLPVRLGVWPAAVLMGVAVTGAQALTPGVYSAVAVAPDLSETGGLQAASFLPVAVAALGLQLFAVLFARLLMTSHEPVLSPPAPVRGGDGTSSAAPAPAAALAPEIPPAPGPLAFPGPRASSGPEPQSLTGELLPAVPAYLRSGTVQEDLREPADA